MELVTEPSVLVLDEPTSGLDSYTALSLMRTMKGVAGGGGGSAGASGGGGGAGRIVLLSFHQPSPAMFSLLDRAFLMAQVCARAQRRWRRGGGVLLLSHR